MADNTLAADTIARTSAAPLVDTDILRVVRTVGPASYKATMAQVATYMATAMAALALSATTIELGHASDTTISRVSAGRIAVEGSNVIMASDIGVSVQAYDADLAAWAGVNPSSYSTTAQIAAAYQPLDADLTSWAGVTRADGFDAFVATPSSANLRTLLSDESGTGALLFAGGALGAATATSINGLTITTTTGTFTLTNGKTLSVSNTVTLTATDGSTLAIGAGGTLASAAYVATGTSGATIPLLNVANTFSAQTIFNVASGSATTPIIIRNSSGGPSVLQFNPAGATTRYAEIEVTNDGSNNISMLLKGSAGGVLATGVTVRHDGLVTLSTAAVIPSPTLSGTVAGSFAISGAITADGGNTYPFRLADATYLRFYNGASGSDYALGKASTTDLILYLGATPKVTFNGSGVANFADSPTVAGNAVMTVAGGTFTGRVTHSVSNTLVLNRPDSNAYKMEMQDNGTVRGYVRSSSTLAFEVLSSDTSKNLSFYQTGGLVVGAATGGDKGNGTINTGGDIYKNNTAFTNPDYVFEHFYRGEIVEFAANEGASEYGGLMSLDALRTFTRNHLHLPQVPKTGGVGIFERGDYLLRATEENTLYILELHEKLQAANDRIEQLEAKLAA